MLMIILFAICLCFTIEMLLLGANVFSIVACACVAVLMILELLKKREKWMTAVGLLVIAVCMIGASLQERESYILSYGNELEKTSDLLDKEKTEEALAVLSNMEESYGLTEDIILQRALCYYVDSDYEEAIVVMEDYPHKTSKNYYSMMEGIYKGMEEEGKEQLYNLYIEAANEWPSWLEMQMSAGVVQLDRKEYSAAKYYFQRAYYIDYDNGMASYLLGATAYYMGDYKECLLYYNQALEKGVSGDIKAAIASQISIVQEGK